LLVKKRFYLLIIRKAFEDFFEGFLFDRNNGESPAGSPERDPAGTLRLLFEN
jgi:hypothetical protein